RNTDYAVKALRYICRNKGKITSVKDLTYKLDIPRPFLRKILQILNKKKLLKSFKGRRGGFMLSSPPGEIFLIDLIEIFQGPFMLSECIFKKGICSDKYNCALKRKIDDIEKNVVAELNSITLASLL
ncbi:MAG: hypothetical protein A3K16_00180, partial [Omnitrophica bacterium RIFCSPLOWO2_01_FULL_45_24]